MPSAMDVDKDSQKGGKRGLLAGSPLAGPFSVSSANAGVHSQPIANLSKRL